VPIEAAFESLSQVNVTVYKGRHSMVKFRRGPIAAALVALTALGGTAIASAAPAAATVAPAPSCVSSTLSPTGQFCVPQFWLTETNVVTNDGLLRIDSVEFANNSSEASSVSQTETVTGSLSAGLSIAIPIPGAQGQTAATLTPNFSGLVSGSVSIAGSASVPPQCDGTLYFGIHYVMADVIVYIRNIYGQVTSKPALAWSPTTFGYSDGFEIPVPGPNPPNPLCTEAASVQPVVPNLAQFLQIVAAGPTAS
jgi:hypothetical protein